MQKITQFSVVFLFMLVQNLFVQAQDCTDTTVQLIINSGDWASEIYWSITDSNGQMVDTSTVDYQNNTEYTHNLCLESSSCYQLNLYDSYGDGWNGGSYQLQYVDAAFITSGELEGAYSFGSQSFCVSDNSLCETNVIDMQLETGIWAEEISWSITDTLGTLVDSLDASYSNNSIYNFQLCIDDGCYFFNMYDTYGDSWLGASFQLENQDEETVASGELTNGAFSQVAFSLNSDCNIDVCEDESATNYNVVSTEGSDCIYLSENVNLLYNWYDSSLEVNGLGGNYTEVYGYANDGKEYAIIGSTFGTHFIDVTNPTNSIEVASIAGAYSASNVTHRDYHTMGDYLYAVCDQGASTLQIIDLSKLPETVEVLYDSDVLFSRSHNIFIDTLVQKLYSCSTKGYDEADNYWTSSLCVYDLSNPLEPSFLHNMGEYIPGTHDIWVDNDTAFINCPGTGTLVWEFNDSPSQISTFTSYPDFGTNHSGWKSGDVYVFAEENNGYDVKVVDASDPTNLELLSTFNSDVNEFSIAHNLMINDNLVYISYYWDGLQAFDITDPQNPVKVAYYDTYMPENFGGYKGAWGVYAFLPSGNILISDIANGLFVLEMNLVEEQEIPIQEGWNMVSTYMVNEELTAPLFVSPNSDNIIIMKNILGDAYLPSWGFDGIGEIEYGQGYQLKAEEFDTLHIQGVFNSTMNSIGLNEGWNMIGVLSKTELELEPLFDEVQADLLIVKDYQGLVYLPQWNFNSIGMIIPSKGYQVKMEAPGILTY